MWIVIILFIYSIIYFSIPIRLSKREKKIYEIEHNFNELLEQHGFKLTKKKLHEFYIANIKYIDGIKTSIDDNGNILYILKFKEHFYVDN